MLSSALVSLLLLASASGDGWTSYSNGRYGYSVQVPAGLTGQGESGNGDGQEFKDASGQVSLKVWASEVADLGGGEHTDLAWVRRATLEDWKKQGIRVTYQPKGKEWWVLSGEDSRGRVFYRKQWQKSGILYGFEWSHPRGAKPWQDAPARISQGFKLP